MRRKGFLIGVLLSTAVMAAVPIGIFGFASEDSGMVLALAFLFIVAPVWSAVSGLLSGLWALPLISAALFLPGMWIGSETFSPDFWLYAAVYAGIGLPTMAIARLLEKRSAASAADA